MGEQNMFRNVGRSVFAISLLALALSPGSALSKSLKDQLVGTWTVVSWEQTRNDGTRFQRFGANPKGINIFDAKGHFMIMFARPDLPKIASNDANNPTPDEALAVVKGAVAYFGTYSVDEAAKTIDLRVEASTLANQIGVPQKRKITMLTGKELKYTNVTAVGASGNIDISFRRAK